MYRDNVCLTAVENVKDCKVGRFTVRRNASAVYAIALCPSVCLSVRLSVISRCSIRTVKHGITQTRTTIARAF